MHITKPFRVFLDYSTTEYIKADRFRSITLKLFCVGQQANIFAFYKVSDAKVYLLTYHPAHKCYLKTNGTNLSAN